MISVIVPVYNVESTLEKCIESILAQSYKDLEIILVNDGSTDQSTEICRRYREKDHRIRLIEKENGGLSSARNAALDCIKGEYVAFVDSDDWIDCDFIKVLHRNAIEYDCDIAIAYTYNISETGIKWRPYQAENHLFVGKEALVCNLGVGYPCDDAVWNKLYKAQLFKNVRFPIGRIHEDTFVMSSLMAQANRVYFDSSVSYYYLQRENSLVHQRKFGKGDIDKVDAYSSVFKFVLKHYPQYLELIGNKYCNCVVSSLCRLDHSELMDKKEVKQRLLGEYLQVRNFYQESFVQRIMIWLLEHNSLLPGIALSFRNKKSQQIRHDAMKMENK